MSASGSMQFSDEAARKWCAVHADRAAQLRRALEDIAKYVDDIFSERAREFKEIARDAIHDDDVTLDIAENGEREDAP